MPKIEVTLRMDDPRRTFAALTKRDDGTMQMSLRTLLTQAFPDKDARDCLAEDFGIITREVRIIHDEHALDLKHREPRDMS